MTKLVTIAVPIYRRLEYLPNVLQMVASQDYLNIELLVSDNGMNGSKVRDLVQAHYPKPYKFRQNPRTVEMMPHFNQLIHEASGEYWMLFMDDDEISRNYISELVSALERHPQATIALSRQEVVDFSGAVVRASRDPLPDILSGPEFIRAMWQRYEFGFKSVTTFLGRTERMRAGGGFPNFTRGTHPDNALVVQMCIDNYVVFSSKCVWRNRAYDTSHGMSIPISDLAAATNEFIKWLDDDPILKRYAAEHESEWRILKDILVQMAWNTYLDRWQNLYRKRLTYWQWVRAAFALRPIPAYYKRVFKALLKRPGVQTNSAVSKPPETLHPSSTASKR